MMVLKKGREKSLKRRHPWIFSGAVEKVGGKAGDTVDVLDSSKHFLARAAYSPKSQIRARVWTFDPQEQVDADFFRKRIEKALALREALPAAKHTNALRLIHGESDGLPGLVVDHYADVLVAQFLAAGVDRWREAILDALAELTGCTAVYERSDAEVRNLEGLPPRIGQADDSFAHRERRPGRDRHRQLAGNQPELADRPRERERSAGALHEQPDAHRDGDERHGDVRRALRLVLVVVGEHTAILSEGLCPSDSPTRSLALRRRSGRP